MKIADNVDKVLGIERCKFFYKCAIMNPYCDICLSDKKARNYCGDNIPCGCYRELQEKEELQ